MYLHVCVCVWCVRVSVCIVHMYQGYSIYIVKFLLFNVRKLTCKAKVV